MMINEGNHAFDMPELRRSDLEGVGLGSQRTDESNFYALFLRAFPLSVACGCPKMLAFDVLVLREKI